MRADLLWLHTLFSGPFLLAATRSQVYLLDIKRNKHDVVLQTNLCSCLFVTPKMVSVIIKLLVILGVACKMQLC